MENTYRIVGFGDSITEGALATKPEYTWLAVTTDLIRTLVNPNIEVINRSKGDNTVSPRTRNYKEASKPSALERVNEDLIDLTPDLAFICWGLNDMRFGTPVETFIEDLENIVKLATSALPDCKFVMTNVFHMTGFDLYEPRDKGSIELTHLYNLAIAQLGKKYDIPVSDVSAAMAFNDSLITPDGVHGNGHCS